MSEAGQAMILIQGGPQSGRVVTLGGLAVTIGRRSDNDVIVDDPSVSRRHTLIMDTAGGYVVRDLNSTNGTFVNRERLGDGEHTFESGDLIRVGGSEITLLLKLDAPMTVRLTVPDPPDPSGAVDQAKPGSVDGKAADLMRFLEGRRRTAVSREVVEEDASRPVNLVTVGEFGFMLI